jgi:hypothetical protein
MKNQIEMTGSICQITANGDLYFAPPSRNLIYLSLILAGSLGLWLWLKALGPISATLVLVSTMGGAISWAKQPKVLFSPASATFTWCRWFWRTQCSFTKVLKLNVSLERRGYAWSAHLVDLKRPIEMYARLELILHDGSRLYLGKIAGEHANDRAMLLAQTVAKMIGVSVSTIGYT